MSKKSVSEFIYDNWPREAIQQAGYEFLMYLHVKELSVLLDSSFPQIAAQEETVSKYK